MSSPSMKRRVCLSSAVLVALACRPEAPADSVDQPAAASEPSEPAEPAEPSEPSEPSEPAEPAEPSEPVEPIAVQPGELTITASEAAAVGLPSLGFHVDTTGSAMIGSKLGPRTYLQLSGPPGGPLLLAVSPAQVGSTFAEVIDGNPEVLAESEVQVAGRARRAAAWITGESLARTSWCAILLGREDAGDEEPALLLQLGVGHSGDDVRCETTLEHHVLGPVVASFALE